MKYLSVVINADTRAGFKESESTAKEMFNGCRSIDFLVEGVKNKIKFIEGFEKEVILFIDQHEEIPEGIISELRSMVDTLVIRKHNKRLGDIKEYNKFNDLNYISALQLAKGEIIFHFDQDCSAFTRDNNSINKLIGLLDQYDYVSYPSNHSPFAVHDTSFDYQWVSTRFFICKRDTLDFTEIQKCLLSDEYLYGKYPASRKNGWTEHILGLISKYNGKGVYYPTIELDDYAIFCWNKYYSGTLGKLNNMNYDEVKNYIDSCLGIHYPNDLTARQI